MNEGTQEIQSAGSAQKSQDREIPLSDGRVAKIGQFKGKHILKAQRIAGGDSDKMIMALICVCVTIDNEPIIIEELEDMNGADVMSLMGEFSVNFTQEGKN